MLVFTNKQNQDYCSEGDIAFNGCFPANSILPLRDEVQRKCFDRAHTLGSVRSALEKSFLWVLTFPAEQMRGRSHSFSHVLCHYYPQVVPPEMESYNTG